MASRRFLVWRQRELLGGGGEAWGEAGSGAEAESGAGPPCVEAAAGGYRGEMPGMPRRCCPRPRGPFAQGGFWNPVPPSAPGWGTKRSLGVPPRLPSPSQGGWQRPPEKWPHSSPSRSPSSPGPRCLLPSPPGGKAGPCPLPSPRSPGWRRCRGREGAGGQEGRARPEKQPAARGLPLTRGLGGEPSSESRFLLTDSSGGIPNPSPRAPQLVSERLGAEEGGLSSG